jgi:ABC-type nitrate/sulfonate/bicarbonate transport system permease component
LARRGRLLRPAPVLRRALETASRLLLIAALVGGWQIAATHGAINRLILPPPSEVGSAWWSALRDGTLFDDATASLYRIALGFALASALGIVVGIATGLLPLLERQLGWIVEILRPIPPIAWIPLAILWFGIGDRPAIFIVFLGAFFPIFTATFLGIRGVDRVKIDSARSLGASRWLVVTDVLLPGALPTILLGLRTGLGVGWMSVIAAELIGARSGLGYRVQLDQVLLQSDGIIAGMLTIGLAGIAMQSLLTLTIRVFLPQHHRRLAAQQRLAT